MVQLLSWRGGWIPRSPSRLCSKTWSTTSAPAQDGGLLELTEEILCCLNRALAALQGDGVVDVAAGGCRSKKRRSSPPGAADQSMPKRRARANRCRDADENREEEHDGGRPSCGGSTARRTSRTASTQGQSLVRPFSATILCTYKHDNGCKATRQVQAVGGRPLRLRPSSPTSASTPAAWTPPPRPPPLAKPKKTQQAVGHQLRFRHRHQQRLAAMGPPPPPTMMSGAIPRKFHKP
ncbi:hypothetical protein EJB05_36043, partial [Eragrostis curvula]